MTFTHTSTRPAPRGRRARLFVAAVALVAGASCGYHLIGASSTLPTHLERLYIAPFVNQTGRVELDQRIAEEVTQEWLRRGRFRLVASADEAQAVLSGTIVSVGSFPVRFDEQGRATEYQLTAIADVQLVDRTTERPTVLWHDPRFSRGVNYQIDVTGTDFFDKELEAIERLARDFSRGLVITILEGF